MLIMGVDPGITRCGVAVVEVNFDRSAELKYVGVIRSQASVATQLRLAQIGSGLEELLDNYQPEVMAIERVFSHDNLQSVTTTMQVMGVAMYIAGCRDLPLAIHTPSEVKAAVTGSGTAGKAQVQQMVARVLHLDKPPKPADAADAVAIALTHGWRGTGLAGSSGDSTVDISLSGKVTSRGNMTAAQQQWAQAAAQSRRRGVVDPRWRNR